MKKFELIILIITSIATSGMANPEDIEKILQKPEAEIDVGFACLLLSYDAKDRLEFDFHIECKVCS